MAADSMVTTAVLNYIDYERKRLLAKQGIICFLSGFQVNSFELA